MPTPALPPADEPLDPIPLELLELVLLELPELMPPEELEAFKPTVPLEPAILELLVVVLEFDALELLPSPQAESARAATQTAANGSAR